MWCLRMWCLIMIGVTNHTNTVYHNSWRQSIIQYCVSALCSIVLRPYLCTSDSSWLLLWSSLSCPYTYMRISRCVVLLHAKTIIIKRHILNHHILGIPSYTIMRLPNDILCTVIVYYVISCYIIVYYRISYHIIL